MLDKSKFIAAFILAQREMGSALKESVNPYFKSKYADLNAVREAVIPVLNAQNIAVLQPIIQKEGKSYVRTILMHESGQSLESDVEIIFSKINDAQAQGSGITYARRYGLQSLVNIGAEDDDGNKAAEDIKPKDDRKRLADAVRDEMPQMQRTENEKQFKKIKIDIESCGSLSELQAVWEKNKKAINSLLKYCNKDEGDLYQILLISKDEMKESLNPQEEKAAKESPIAVNA